MQGKRDTCNAPTPPPPLPNRTEKGVMESQLNQVTKKFTIIEVTCYDWCSLKVLSQFLASQSNPCQQLRKKNKK